MSAHLGWQDAAVVFVVVGALAWLVSRRWRSRSGAACQECPGCAPGARPAREPGATDPGGSGAFVPLEALTKRD